MMAAVRSITPISPRSTPSSINVAISNGMIISQHTSAIIHRGVTMDALLNSPTWRNSSFTVLKSSP